MQTSAKDLLLVPANRRERGVRNSHGTWESREFAGPERRLLLGLGWSFSTESLVSALC